MKCHTALDPPLSLYRNLRISPERQIIKMLTMFEQRFFLGPIVIHIWSYIGNYLTLLQGYLRFLPEKALKGV